MNRITTLSRAWHGVLAAVALASLITELVLTARGHYAPTATRFVREFSYFTIESNILVFAAATLVVLNPGRDGRLWRILRLDMMLGIIITGVVYAAILAKDDHPHGAAWWSNLGFHYIDPWWALAGWLLFGPRPRIDRRTFAWAFVWPALWIGYTLLHGAVSDWYPYDFTDVVTYGYATVLVNLAVVVVIALVFAGILALLDRWLPGGVRTGNEDLDVVPAASQEPV